MKMIVKQEIELSENVTQQNVNDIIAQQIEEHDLLIYMKGNPLLPQCGFSAQVIEIFNRMEVSYRTFDILSNDTMREGLKEFSNWPTFPQVYFNQKFIGGCDIVTEMYNSGDLSKLVHEQPS